MSRDTPAQKSAARPPTWSEGPSRDALELIAEGVTEVAGFGIAAISVAREDGKLEVMAVAGSEEARIELQGRRTPLESLLVELEKADDWGLLRFVPHERLDPAVGEDWGWVPDVEPIDDPDAWHPMDLLLAPLLDEGGVLRGTLAIDLPVDGKRPGAEQRRMLHKYAEQAGRAVLTTLEREALAEKVRLADAARHIVRNASAQLKLDGIIAECQTALVEGFQAHGMWIQTFDDDGEGSGTIYAANGVEVELPAELVEVAAAAAKRAWALQRVEVVSADRPFGVTITEAQGDRILEFLASIGVESILFVPLGAGPECLGNLVLTRIPGDPDWTDHESAAALDIGHDLGRAILNARTFEREHHLVEELQALDTYKSQLIATVSHELKNPLTAISGHLEMLEASPDLPSSAMASVRAMDRGARRLGRVVDDLLLLSKVGDPNYPIIPVPVDVHRILVDVLDLSSLAADRKSLRVSLDVPDEPVLALGDAAEIDRICANLVSNAVKYTPAGRSVEVALSRTDGHVVLRVSDEGLGISPEDQKHLFTEFFRSNNPEAVAEPGTGLGLAIVKRIVDRHGGRVALESELGKGSTFTVSLPAARS